MSDVHFDSVNNINYPVNDTSSSEMSRRSKVSVIAFSHKCSIVISAASHIGVEAKFVTDSGLDPNASADRKISLESQSINREVPEPEDDEKKIPGYDYPMDLSKKYGTEVSSNSSLLDMDEFDLSCKSERKHPVPRCIEAQKGEQEVSKLLQIREVPLDLPVTTGRGWAKTSFGMDECGLWGEKRGFPKSVVEGTCNDKRKRHQVIEANYRQRKKEYIRNFDQIINNLKQQCCQAAYQVLECKKFLGSFPADCSPLTVKIFALHSQEDINVFFDNYVTTVQERLERDKEARILKERAEKGSPIAVDDGGRIIDSKVRHKLTQRNYRVRTTFDYQMKKKIESEISSDLQKILNDVATFSKWQHQWVSTPNFGVE